MALGKLLYCTHFSHSVSDRGRYFPSNTSLLTGLVENTVPLSRVSPALRSYPHPQDREKSGPHRVIGSPSRKMEHPSLVEGLKILGIGLAQGRGDLVKEARQGDSGAQTGLGIISHSQPALSPVPHLSWEPRGLSRLVVMLGLGEGAGRDLSP